MYTVVSLLLVCIMQNKAHFAYIADVCLGFWVITLDLNVYVISILLRLVFSLFITLAQKRTVTFSMFCLFFFSLMGLNIKLVG